MKPYRIGTELEVQHVVLSFHQGGLGDLIGQLPAVEFIKKYHPYVKLELWVHSYGISLIRNVFGDDTPMFVVKDFSSMTDVNPNLVVRSPYLHKVSNLAAHITEHAFLTLVGVQPNGSEMNYLKLNPVDISRFNLPKDYVVLTTGHTSKTREWKPEIIKQVSDYCVEKGYSVVYLGKKQTEATETDSINSAFKADYSNGIDLIDKTSILEAGTIMGQAKAVLGVDNGLLHLASMTDVPVIWGFTSVLPEHRLPFRNDIMGYNSGFIDCEELRCGGCQSKMVFASKDHAFTKCYYNDYACLDLMSFEKWKKELDILFG